MNPKLSTLGPNPKLWNPKPYTRHVRARREVRRKADRPGDFDLPGLHPHALQPAGTVPISVRMRRGPRNEGGHAYRAIPVGGGAGPGIRMPSLRGKQRHMKLLKTRLVRGK